MSGTDPQPSRPPRPAARTALRWIVAAAVGGGTSIALFVAMAAAIDAVDIVEQMFRIFPLNRTTLSEADACAAGEVPAHRAVPIEGVVGFWQDDVWRPLADAAVEGENAVTGAVPVDVAGDGSFRFVAAFPNEAAAACGEEPPEAAPQWLTVRAQGCAERRVPVTAAWVPHAVALDCPERM